MRPYSIALIHDVFYDDPSNDRLVDRLLEAREQGATLAVLPELPLNAWSPAHKNPIDEDAEQPGGKRQQQQADAARRAGIAMLGGAIVKDPETHVRHNTALLFDAKGQLVDTYAKLHLPEEEGYWETYHYAPGLNAPQIIDGLGPAVGIQICSDTNRPVGAQLLAAQGVEIILAPRATPLSTYPRWRLVYRATAVTSAAFVVSVNRPRPEAGVPMGGASLVVDPDGSVLTETADPVTVVTLDLDQVQRMRKEYPGYMPYPDAIYARAWKNLKS